ADFEAQDRAAIVFRDYDILGNVDETTRQVPGVGRLERRIRQTLTRTVRRDEVLENRQTFAEVRLDRAFNDFAATTGEFLLWLRHEAAHTGQLTNLVTRTT